MLRYRMQTPEYLSSKCCGGAKRCSGAEAAVFELEADADAGVCDTAVLCGWHTVVGATEQN